MNEPVYKFERGVNTSDSSFGGKNRRLPRVAMAATAFTAIIAATSGNAGVAPMGNAEFLTTPVAHHQIITSGVASESGNATEYSKAYLGLASQLHAKAIRVESLFQSLASGEPIDAAQVHQEAKFQLSEISSLSTNFFSKIKYPTATAGPSATIWPIPQLESRPTMISAPIIPAMDRIRSFAELESSWDGDGAARPSSISVSEASILLTSSLDTNIYASGAKVDVVPTPAGGLLLEWRSFDVRVQINIHDDGQYSGFTASIAEGKTRDRRIIAGADREKVREILSSF